jgi:hypothetical protein
MMQHLAADVSDNNTSACVQTDNAAAPCQKMTELADANASVSCHQETGSVTIASPHHTMTTPKKNCWMNGRLFVPRHLQPQVQLQRNAKSFHRHTRTILHCSL